MRIVLSCAICIADAASALPPPLYRGWHYFEQFDGKDFPQPAPQEVLDAAKEVRESAGWGGGAARECGGGHSGALRALMREMLIPSAAAPGSAPPCPAIPPPCSGSWTWSR